MNVLSGFLIGLIALMPMTSPAHAELSLQQDRLTLHVQAVPLEEVLLNLSQQGDFHLTILDKQITDKVTVTEHFDGVPIEDGLSRLLAQWNYGLTKQQGSRQIEEVFLVSKRIKPEDLPTPTPKPVLDAELGQRWGEEAETLTPFTDESSEEEYFDAQFAEEFKEEGFESDQETFTEEMLPDDLPPEIREAMLEDLARMNNHLDVLNKS